MATSRIRPHKKARTGCERCKQRKVRCNEAKPTCLACATRQETCRYGDLNQFPLLKSPISSDAIHSSRSSPNADMDSSVVPDLRMLDMELMFNYTTATSYTITENLMIRSAFRNNLPALGFKHPFLMRALLALSALHIAYNCPSRREELVPYAVAQQREATKHATSLLEHINDDTAIPLYVFSILTYVYSLAAPAPEQGILLLSDDGNVADWLYLLRGTKTIALIKRDAIASSEFGPMFTAGQRRVLLRNQETEIFPPLHDLLKHVNSNLNAILSDNVSEDQQMLARTKYSIYETTILELSRTFTVVNSSISTGDLQVTDASIWLFTLTDDYLELLREHDNIALVIMAFFCVLMKKFDVHWWMSGRGTSIFRMIWKLVDEEGRLLMQWAQEELELLRINGVLA